MHEFDTSDDDRGTRNLQAEIDQAIAGSPNEEHAGRLMRAFTAWQAIVDYKKTETKRLSEKLAARIAQFNEAMAVGHSTTGDQILKLGVVEQRWQDLEETRAEKKDVTAALREQVKTSVQKIKDLIEEAKSTQLSLFQSSADDADDAGVEDDAGHNQ
jgi:enoyl-CoA hydratase/carnithine racemase